MKLEEVLPAFRDDRKIRRKRWAEPKFLQAWQGPTVQLSVEDILTDDWEIMEEFEEVEVWDWTVRSNVTGEVEIFFGLTRDEVTTRIPSNVWKVYGRIEESKRTTKRHKR